MKKRKAFLVIELDADETAGILPPHLQGLLSRPLVGPIQTRQAPGEPWFPPEGEEKREQRTKGRLARVRDRQMKMIERGELNPPEK